MKKALYFSLIFLILIGCKKDKPITFTEINSISNNYATIEINIPKADGNTSVSKSINTTIETLIISVLNFNGKNSENINLEEAIKKFQTEYKQFKDDFEESDLVWEAVFDGEIIYQSTEIVCIALNSFTFTGGAHGNMNISLLNFNPETGQLFTFNNLINNKDTFTKLAKTYFDKEIASKSDSDTVFFENNFMLPENIGFNDEGIILLYNTYEIASYAQGLTEFTIPYEEMDALLKIR